MFAQEATMIDTATEAGWKTGDIRHFKTGMQKESIAQHSLLPMLLFLSPPNKLSGKPVALTYWERTRTSFLAVGEGGSREDVKRDLRRWKGIPLSCEMKQTLFICMPIKNGWISSLESRKERHVSSTQWRCTKQQTMELIRSWGFLCPGGKWEEEAMWMFLSLSNKLRLYYLIFFNTVILSKDLLPRKLINAF